MHALPIAPLRAVDRFLNGITMYRTVLYGLLVLAAAAVAMSFLGIITYDGWAVSLLLFLAVGTCFAVNAALARLMRVPANSESWLITALILFFLFSPILGPGDAVAIVLASLVAMGSKYVLAWRGKHVFNPAAFAAAVLGLAGWGYPVWWVGTPALLPFALVVGLPIVRKIRRFPLFLACVGSSIAVVILLGYQSGMDAWESTVQHLLSWPIVFFASVMVTEPLTMPPRRGQQMLYGGIVGALSSWPIVLGPVFFTPELVLLLGNLYAYAVSLRRRLKLVLREKRVVARDTYEYAFTVDPPLRFLPGQYLEWTLPHARADGRGNRRYFTIASSPTERDVLLGVKIGPERSSFKETLLAMEPGGVLWAGQLGGDFVLPRRRAEKLAFLAGGIGITPFRSMIKHLIDTGDRRDVVLFYGARSVEDLAYRDVLRDAERAFGLRVVYVLKDDVPGAATVRALDEASVRTHVPDYRERTFYISGPVAMVDAYKETLRAMGVHRTRIVTDYFPGFA